ncbi:MAG: hypothetical protein KJ674_04245 [Nanoarchaeota archaeon]|nr:hypothetical protein [Nanoarchaeota archaeon]
MKRKNLKYLIIPASIILISSYVLKDQIVDNAKKTGARLIQKLNTINKEEQKKTLDYLTEQTDTLSLFIEPGNPMGVDEVFHNQYIDRNKFYPENLRNAYRTLFLEDNGKSTLTLEAGVPIKNYPTIQDSIDSAVANYLNRLGTKTAIFRVYGKEGSEQFRQNHQKLLEKGFKPIRSPR